MRPGPRGGMMRPSAAMALPDSAGWRVAPSASGAVAQADPPSAGYWSRDWMAAIVLYAFVVIRLPEMVPWMAPLKPVLMSTLLLGFFFVLKTRTPILVSAVRDRVLLLLVAYVGWIVLIIPFAKWRGGAVDTTVTLPFGLAVVALFLLCAPTRRNLDRILIGGLIAAAVNGMLVISRGSMTAGRLTTGTTFDPNDLGTLVATLLPFALVFAFRRKGIERVVGIAAGVVLLLVLVKTASRGGTIGVVLAIMVLLAGFNPRKAVTGIVATVALGFVVWTTAPPTFKDRLSTLTSLDEDYNSTEDTGRIGTWSRGIGYALANPITGLGPGSFSIAEGERQRANFTRGAYYTAHNTYVQAYAELGLLGGTLLVLVLAVTAWRAYKLWIPPWLTGRSGLFMPEVFASVVGFASSAFFLSLAYNYLFFGVLLFPTLAYRVMLAENTEGPAAGMATAGNGAKTRPVPTGRGGATHLQFERRSPSR